jgi:hypothetical protein
MAKSLVSPIPAPASPSTLADFEQLCEQAASWIQPAVEGATPFLGDVISAGVDVGEVVAVDADPPVALLGLAIIVLIFGVGLLVHAIGYPLSKLPWPISTVGNAIMNAGQQILQYGLDIVEWMIRPLIQLAQALWRGIDKLLGLGLATAASLAMAIYKHIHIIGPHQIAANDIGIAKEAASAINSIIATLPDYEMKLVKAAHLDIEHLTQSIPRIVPATAAGAMTALARMEQANTQVIDECTLPWCDTTHTADEIQNALKGLFTGLLGAALFCELTNNPSGAAAVISRDAGGFLAGLGAACVINGDFAGGAMMELVAYAVENPSAAAARLVSVVCG